MTTKSDSLSSLLLSTLSPYTDSGSVAGIVGLIADKDKVLGSAAVGYRDVAIKDPIRLDSMFWMASQTKPITAAALMMLVDDGKVNLDDAVSNFIPEFEQMWVIESKDDVSMTLRRPQRQITLRDVLSHTSGLPFRSAVENPSLDGNPIVTNSLSYSMELLTSEPGMKYSYSNEGINVIGRIIEIVSGMNFSDFLNSRLIVPLGMTDTTFWPNAEQLSRLAKTYKPNPEGTELVESVTAFLRYPLDDQTRYAMPGGGLFSTAGDMLKFCQMLLNLGTIGGKTYLSKEAVEEMTSRQTREDNDTSYGLGFFVQPDHFGHGGALYTNMVIFKEVGAISIYCVQHQGFLNDGSSSRDAFETLAAKVIVDNG